MDKSRYLNAAYALSNLTSHLQLLKEILIQNFKAQLTLAMKMRKSPGVAKRTISSKIRVGASLRTQIFPMMTAVKRKCLALITFSRKLRLGRLLAFRLRLKASYFGEQDAGGIKFHLNAVHAKRKLRLSPEILSRMQCARLFK